MCDLNKDLSHGMRIWSVLYRNDYTFVTYVPTLESNPLKAKILVYNSSGLVTNFFNPIEGEVLHVQSIDLTNLAEFDELAQSFKLRGSDEKRISSGLKLLEDAVLGNF